MSEYIVDYPQFEHLSIHEFVLSFKEKIVRCRDCRYYVEEWNRKFRRSTIYCDWLDGAHVEPDGFCAWGERKC